MELYNLVETWLKENYKHFSMTENNIAGIRLHWIYCDCNSKTSMPPTPRYDIIIEEDCLYVWDVRDNSERDISAASPTFFDQLKKLLDDAHSR